MSWHCSLELVEAFSQANIWVTGSCVRWRETRIAERSLCGGRKTKASQSSPSGTTSTPSTESHGMALSMSFLLASPASLFPTQEKEKESKTSETSGLLPQESLAKYDPDTSSWRTYHPLFNIWETYSPETWPASGTIKNGQLYLRDKPEPDTSENDGGWWPTPTANTRPNEGNVRLLRKQVLDGNLTEEEATRMLNGKSPFSAQGAVREYPTPTVSGNYNRKGASSTSGDGLATVVKENYSWPTPNASDHRDRGNMSNPAIQRRIKLGKQVGLTMAVKDKPGKGTLNPDWVEWLMGWPIGWTSLDFINIDNKGWWRYCMSVEPARYWEQDPADIPVGEKYHTPRLTTKKEYRAERLKALGNGQVPQQAELAWKVLS